MKALFDFWNLNHALIFFFFVYWRSNYKLKLVFMQMSLTFVCFVGIDALIQILVSDIRPDTV